MIATLMMAALQAAPVPPATPAPSAGDRTVVREIVIHDHADKAAKGKEERREIVIIRSDDRKAAAEGDRRVRIVDVRPGEGGEQREVRILREPGAAAPRIAMIDCDASSKVDAEATDKDGKKTRVMVCAQGGNQVEALERASKRIAENKELPEDVRARVLAQMSAQIARLKSAR